MLSEDFRFSQHSLSDFVDCPRRFYLRHVARQAWPLATAGPNGIDPAEYQDHLRHGALFHRWVERHWLGIPIPELGTQDPELSVWWSHFLVTDFGDLPEQRLPELELSAPLGKFRLYARFDLLAVPHGRREKVVILDWKTLRGENAPSYDFLKRRSQTRAYLYVLATAGAPFNGGQPFAPEQCVMRYWLANFPQRPWVEITYSQAEYEQDATHLLALAQDIAQRAGEAQFPKADDERKCTHCTYRTLCRQRGVAGEPIPDEALDMNIAEVQALDY